MNGSDRDPSCSVRSCQMFCKYFGKITYIIFGLLFVSLDNRSFFFIVRGYVDIPGICFSFWYILGVLSYSPSSSSRIFRIRRTVYPAITRIRMTGYQWDPQSAKLMCPSASLLSAGMLSSAFPLPSASAPVSVLSATSVVSSEPVSASAQSVEAVSVRTSPTAPSSASSLTPPVSGSQEGVEVKEMDRVRKMIADHMVMSKHTSPHVTNVVEVDVTKLVKWRDKNKEAFFRREGVKLTYMPAITEAVTKALVAYPQVNVSVDGYNVLFKKHINVGIAVSLNDGNLIVPVIHDADRLKFEWFGCDH